MITDRAHDPCGLVPTGQGLHLHIVANREIKKHLNTGEKKNIYIYAWHQNSSEALIGGDHGEQLQALREQDSFKLL